ncbi:hypothetical protein E2C01_086599 [Portunus trituberculatus]|uniref:Uncharacterized protein n=1 Tax=Portunus trituberculatus TaxID=210409 RepID=A0A5B7JA54_PORTR|nr:hypothetical protein [Portunus trituberculatus]
MFRINNKQFPSETEAEAEGEAEGEAEADMGRQGQRYDAEAEVEGERRDRKGRSCKSCASLCVTLLGAITRRAKRKYWKRVEYIDKRR